MVETLKARPFHLLIAKILRDLHEAWSGGGPETSGKMEVCRYLLKWADIPSDYDTVAASVWVGLKIDPEKKREVLAAVWRNRDLGDIDPLTIERARGLVLETHPDLFPLEYVLSRGTPMAHWFRVGGQRLFRVLDDETFEELPPETTIGLV